MDVISPITWTRVGERVIPGAEEGGRGHGTACVPGRRVTVTVMMQVFKAQVLLRWTVLLLGKFTGGAHFRAEMTHQLY